MTGIKEDDHPADDGELAELKFEEEQVDDPAAVETSSVRDKVSIISHGLHWNFVLSSREMFVHVLVRFN